MRRMMGLGAAGIAMLMVASSVWAQQPQKVNVRGTIEAVDGTVLSTKSRDGTVMKVKLADNASVRGVVKMALADVKVGSYVGVATMPQPDGSLKALEVLIFPDAMRGVAEGHRPWDLQPTSQMTNANVEVMVAGKDGQELSLKYKDGEKKIVVPPTTPIVTYAPGSKDELKPGITVFLISTKKDDGSYEAPAVTISRGDVKPPM